MRNVSFFLTCTCLSVYLSVNPCIYVHPSVRESVRPSVSLYVCLSVCLSVRPSVLASVRLPVRVCPSVCLSVSVRFYTCSVVRASVHASVNPCASVRPFVCLYVLASLFPCVRASFCLSKLIYSMVTVVDAVLHFQLLKYLKKNGDDKTFHIRPSFEINVSPICVALRNKL